MRVTEKEAEKKLCPILAPSRALQAPARCENSKCMMWRWAEWPGKEKEPKGYCGLAGNPEVY